VLQLYFIVEDTDPDHMIYFACNRL